MKIIDLLTQYHSKLKFLFWGRLRANFYPGFNLSHSQFGEDMVVRFLASNIKNGFYVDVGAYHPVFFSNTYHFYCRGWRGINIDAAPGSMEIFQSLRTKDINLELCLSSTKDAEVEFFVFEQAAYNTFDVAMANKALALGVALIEKRILKTTTLKDVLSFYLPKETEIDLLTIDIEGMDETILLSNDWKLYKPKILIFEKHNVSIQEIENLSITRYLVEHGYEVVAICGPSVILKHKELR